MEKYYRVAGHVFRLDMDDDVLWEMLPNYAPFETSPAPALFSIRVEGLMHLPDEAPLYDENPDEKDMPRVRVYSRDGWWAFSMSPGDGCPYCFMLETGSDFRDAILRLPEEKDYVRFALNNSMMLLFSLCTPSYDTLAMHSSVVMNGGRGYMFLGVSGTGKSTHSRMWLENIPGTELMNDDNPVVRIGEDGIPVVYGTPWSGKTPCYKNISAPVGAVVQIKQSLVNSIRRQNVLEAYSSLLISCSGLKFHEPSEDLMAAVQAKFLEAVPFYVLDCLPDAGAASVCFNAVSRGL